MATKNFKLAKINEMFITNYKLSLKWKHKRVNFAACSITNVINVMSKFKFVSFNAIYYNYFFVVRLQYGFIPYMKSSINCK